jgi:ribonucleoside-diphosphate reductase beta chain
LIYEMFKIAVEQEIKWWKHILGDGIMWMSCQTTEEYTKWLANERLKSLWLNPLFGWQKNPYRHLDKYQDTNDTKANFFETTVTNYTQSSWLKWSWDF